MFRAASITVCGEVKGVGFRRYVWRVAKSIGLKGFVENLADSDCVKIYVEGEDREIKELLNRIVQNRVYIITHINTVEHEYSGLYTDFAIIKCVGEEEV